MQDPNELFDVVDAEDRVVDQQPRWRVHQEGLRHRAVHILIRNRIGQVLLQQRSLTKDSAPGKWDSSASGHLDAGEGYDEAAYREVREELGLALPEGALGRLFRLEAQPDTGQEFVWVYGADHEGPFAVNEGEIQRVVWNQPEALDAAMAIEPRLFARAFRLVWATYRKVTATAETGDGPGPGAPEAEPR